MWVQVTPNVNFQAIFYEKNVYLVQVRRNMVDIFICKLGILFYLEHFRNKMEITREIK